MMGTGCYDGKITVWHTEPVEYTAAEEIRMCKRDIERAERKMVEEMARKRPDARTIEFCKDEIANAKEKMARYKNIQSKYLTKSGLCDKIRYNN